MKTFTAIAIATLAVSACGGGDGSTSSAGVSAMPTPTPTATPVPTSAPTPTPLPTPNPNALQSTVPLPSYTNTSIQSSIFNEINTVRQQYGVGLVAQNTLLDQAAQSHINYLSINTPSGTAPSSFHIEVTGNPDFTGIMPSDRIAAAGYVARSTAEVGAAYIGSGGSTIPGSAFVDGWMAAPYHRIDILLPNRELGIGYAVSGSGAKTETFATVDFATQSVVNNQLPTNNWLGIWPPANATNIRYGFGYEVPNPIPENNGVCAGYPVSVQAPPGVALQVASFTLNETLSGASISVKQLTSATDPNNELPNNTVVIIPYATLKLNTVYTAIFAGMANGQSVALNWSFTTTGVNGYELYACNPS